MKTYAVFGLGKSGAATVNYLLAKGNKVFAWDDNDETRKNFRHQLIESHRKYSRKLDKYRPSFYGLGWISLIIELISTTYLDKKILNKQNLVECSPPSDWNWAEIDALVLSPGIPLTHPAPHYIAAAANKAGKPIICDIELLWEDNKTAKFIGITGTNGKSTTTALIAHILQQAGLDVAVGGNLGTAALTLGKHDVYVIETSSYQLDLIHNTKFDVAVWLNISPDHIDRHGDIEGYIKAKKRIFKNGNTTRIVGVDDEYSQKIADEFGAIKISRENNLGNFSNLPGIHNMQNINAAFQAAKALGVADDVIIKAIRSFGGLAHRIEFVAEINGVKYINDSKATNADSTMWALKTFDDIYWILGGVPKEGGIEALAEYFPKIRKAYLIGQATDEFAKTLSGKVQYEKCGDMQNAVALASKEAKNGVILLSPACASFDQFKNYEHRGSTFKELVLKHAS